MLIGLGQNPAAMASVPTPAPAVPTDPTSDPSYYEVCNIPLLNVLYDRCYPLTPAELSAQWQTDIAKVAAVNPELAAQATQENAATLAAFCSMHPDECASYNTAVANPALTALFGTSLVQAGQKASDLFSGCGLFRSVDANSGNCVTDWALVGILAMAGVIGVVALSRGRR